MVATIKTTDGKPVRVGHAKLARLRMQMDWQLVQQGYDPASVTAVCMAIDEALERAELADLMRKIDERERNDD